MLIFFLKSGHSKLDHKPRLVLPDARAPPLLIVLDRAVCLATPPSLAFDATVLKGLSRFDEADDEEAGEIESTGELLRSVLLPSGAAAVAEASSRYETRRVPTDPILAAWLANGVSS